MTSVELWRNLRLDVFKSTLNHFYRIDVNFIRLKTFPGVLLLLWLLYCGQLLKCGVHTRHQSKDPECPSSIEYKKKRYRQALQESDLEISWRKAKWINTIFIKTTKRILYFNLILLIPTVYLLNKFKLTNPIWIRNLFSPKNLTLVIFIINPDLDTRIQRV